LEVITRVNVRAFGDVRMIGDAGNEIVPVMTALLRAEEEGLDLVVVSPNANPPVVRVQDFKKIQYETKKAKAKQSKQSETKEIQLKVNISDHDLTTKINAINRFLERGDKVKVVVRLKGREREAPERADALLKKVGAAVPCKMSKVPGPMAIAILEAAK